MLPKIMKTNAAGVALIKSHEKCVLRAYQDPHGRWTIGWGHTGGIHDGDWWEQEFADQMFYEDLANFERAVNAYVRVELNENQFSALVSFVYNEGSGRFFISSVLERLNLGDYAGACTELAAYNKMTLPSGVKISSAELTGRRAEEQALFRMSVSA